MIPASSTAVSTSARPRLLFPETWPPVVRAAVVIAVAAGIAYSGTLSAPFLFDDIPGIVRNSSIRELWPLSNVVLPDAALAGRPFVNLTLALNHAAGGLNPWGYHAFNLLVHILAGFLCFLVVFRTLRAPPCAPRFGASAQSVALLVALWWTLHPLQTEAVACVIRRTELLAGFSCFLTLFAVIRASETTGRGSLRWTLCAVSACGLGVATNELMAVAPVLVLLYDRAFLAGTWREAWRRRGVHLALFATWIFFFFLVRTGGGSEVTAGSGTELAAMDYFLTQCRAVALYVKLAAWPEPLVLDYGMTVVGSLRAIVLQALFLLGLCVAAIVAWSRRPALGFVGIWFFLTLAPNSSVIPHATQTIAEHRMYLPLLAPLALIVAVVFTTAGRRGMIGMVALLMAAAWLTISRNKDYESALTLWSDTVAKAPDNPRARYHYANALSAAGRAADAVQQYSAALAITPRYAAAHYNLAGSLLQLGQAENAVTHYTAALQLEPDSVDTHVNLAAALIRLGRIQDAVTHYESASKLGLLAKEAQLRFGRALAEVGRIDEALVRLIEAARLNPHDAETRVITGVVLSAAGRTTEALQHFIAAVIADPNDADARAALGDLLLESDRPAEALVHYEAALRLRPVEATLFHTSMGHALIRLGRAEESIVHYETALKLNPDNQDAQKGLRMVRSAVRRRSLLKD